MARERVVWGYIYMCRYQRSEADDISISIYKKKISIIFHNHIYGNLIYS